MHAVTAAQFQAIETADSLTTTFDGLVILNGDSLARTPAVSLAECAGLGSQVSRAEGVADVIRCWEDVVAFPADAPATAEDGFAAVELTVDDLRIAGLVVPESLPTGRTPRELALAVADLLSAAVA